MLCYNYWFIICITPLAVLRKHEYITHACATVLLIMVYIWIGLIICLIRAGGVFTFKGALCMFKHT